jgi:hypothetical protein
MFIGVGQTWILELGSLDPMFRRLITLTVVLGGIALGVGIVAAMGPAVTGPATVLDTADRGEQVVINPPPPPPAPATATYRVTLDANWIGATHPSTLPGNAHFSGPVLAVHSTPGSMFAPGQRASSGIEQMAEVGGTSTLLDELRSTPGVTFARSTNGIPAPATPARSFIITVSQSAPLVSLVTMLAPSPDWFVGFADRNTFVGGQWIDTIAFDVGNYDAGTDSGSRFTSGNADTNPAQTISGPRDASFAAAAAENSFASVTITRIG